MGKIIGYHGTSTENAREIITNEFNASSGNEHWLGDGVYFFIEGLSKTPDLQAEKWAIVESWDKKIKANKYSNIAVIKSSIQIEDANLLDLTSSEGVEILEYIIESHKEALKEKAKKISFLDGLVLNFAREENIIEIDVAKGNFYIKFDKESRVSNINLRTANCTICAVFSPNKNLKSKEIVTEKNIEDEVNRRIKEENR